MKRLVSVISAMLFFITVLASPASALSAYCDHGQTGFYTTQTFISHHDANNHHWHNVEVRDRWDTRHRYYYWVRC